MEQKILFSFEHDVNKKFFREIPGLGDATYLGQPVTQKADAIEIYLSTFGEKYIEKDNLLEYTELNDSTTIPFARYWEVVGYSQDLYLLKYSFTYTVTNKETGKSFDSPANAVVFLAVKHNRSGNTLGIIPCYFGVINEEDNVITFDTPLSLKKDNDQYYLKLQQRNKKLNGLLFMPANFPSQPEGPEQKFNIEKIVRLDPNKVGGYKPLVFDISKIFHDPNALEFHYVDNIDLTK